MMAICVGGDSSEEELFWRSAVRSKYPDSKQKAISTVPPPEREIILNIKFCQIDELLSSSTRSVATFGATQSIFLEGNNVRTGFLVVLSGLLDRLIRDNQNLKFYGINIILLYASLSDNCSNDEIEEVTSEIYSFFYAWCKQVTCANNVAVTFDLVSDEAELGTVMKSELRRIKYGDMMAQFGGVY
jgi:hypothetical protein